MLTVSQQTLLILFSWERPYKAILIYIYIIYIYIDRYLADYLCSLDGLILHMIPTLPSNEGNKHQIKIHFLSAHTNLATLSWEDEQFLRRIHSSFDPLRDIISPISPSKRSNTQILRQRRVSLTPFALSAADVSYNALMTGLLVLISMLQHRQAIFESKGD